MDEAEGRWVDDDMNIFFHFSEDADKTFGGSSAKIRFRCKNLVTRRSRFRINSNPALILVMQKIILH
jgi:hypothetical protein